MNSPSWICRIIFSKDKCLILGLISFIPQLSDQIKVMISCSFKLYKKYNIKIQQSMLHQYRSNSAKNQNLYFTSTGKVSRRRTSKMYCTITTLLLCPKPRLKNTISLMFQKDLLLCRMTQNMNPYKNQVMNHGSVQSAERSASLGKLQHRTTCMLNSQNMQRPDLRNPASNTLANNSAFLLHATIKMIPQFLPHYIWR